MPEPGQDDIMMEQTLRYARELRTLYGKERVEEEKRRLLVKRIRKVLSGDALAIVFQPIVDLHTGRIAGFEALSRFHEEPTRGPDLWFADAKEAGLHAELELHAARLAIAELPSIPIGHYLSVNFSPETVVSALDDLLRDFPLDRLVVEITEHARVDDYAPLLNALDALRAKGARVAVDDAGAGFASLRHILLLSPDLIKLDVSLTRNVNSDRERRALASAMISFAIDIGKSIIAEGIETKAELDAFRSLGVRYGQDITWVARRRDHSAKYSSI